MQAIGSPAPTYQWQLDGTNLLNQTNAQLVVPGVALTQSGTYSVLVCNSAGCTNVSVTLQVTPKPLLVITEAMSSEATDTNNSTLDHQDWWELSNLDTFPVRLKDYRFDDNSASLAFACTLTNDVTIEPGESVVLVEAMSADAFRAWWGKALSPNLQIVTYGGSGLSFSANGDAINLWNAAAIVDSDKVCSATFGTATRGISFGYDPDAHQFGALSMVGVNGGFTAAVNGDIGSPGTVINFPRFTACLVDAIGFHSTLMTQPGRNYRIDSAATLAGGNWQPLTNVTAVPNPLFLSQPIGSGARFYRAVMVP